MEHSVTRAKSRISALLPNLNWLVSGLRTMRWLSVVFMMGVVGCGDAGSGEESSLERKAPSKTLYNVGYKMIDIPYVDDGEDVVLTMAVWYPTEAEPEAYTYGGPTKGYVAVDAAPLTGNEPYPMLVFSHGYGGSGLGAVFLTERLAARGWIVVALDHRDKHSAVRIRAGQLKEFDRRGLLSHAQDIAASQTDDRGKYLYRLDELSTVIDNIIASDDFRKVIDVNRIAVGGHSFGGFTALGLCGTIPDRHDPRIKAVLLFSTGAGGYLFTDEELARVRIPLMLFIGELEKEQRRGDETMPELSAKIYRNVSSPKYFIEVKNANHFSFNNRFADTFGSKLMSGTEEQFDAIRQYSILFLEKHVAGTDDSVHIFGNVSPILTRYDEDTSDFRQVSVSETVKATGDEQ